MSKPGRSRGRLIAPVLAGAVVLAPAAPAAPTASAVDPDPRCVIEGSIITDADRELATQACRTARLRFESLWGRPIPAVLVIVEPLSGYRMGIDDGRGVVLWPSSAAMAERVTDGRVAEHLATQWTEVLPHEIAHALLAARFYPDGDFIADGYGTPLPDWLEEGTAIWAESAASRRGRVREARSLPTDRLDLRAILSTPHPATANDAVLSIRDGAAPPADDALYDFYALAIAVIEFLYDTGGTEAIREIGRRFAAAGTLATDTLAFRSLPGMPPTLDGIVAAWEVWLAAGGSAGGSASNRPRPAGADVPALCTAAPSATRLRSAPTRSPTGDSTCVALERWSWP